MREKKRLYDISSRTWEHSADRAALNMLRKMPGIDILIRKLIGITTEKAIRLMSLASSVRVSGRQFPKVHTIAERVFETLDIQLIPELYIQQNPFLNAWVIGSQQPLIILSSSTLDYLSDEELTFIIGHEASHCMSDHVVYKTLLWLLLKISTALIHIPLGNLALGTIIAALKEWDRKSELSADRAGLLAVQDPEIGYTFQMKTAGGPHLGDMNIDDFFIQAAEYDRGGDILDSVHKILNLIMESHPFPILRLTELKSWVDQGSYERILAGEYVRRQEEKASDIVEDFTDAGRQYREDLAGSKDPLAETLTKIGEGIDSLGKQAEDLFKSIFRDE